MQLLGNETSIVLLGSWNPAILQPDWIAKNGFGIEGEVPVRMEFSPVAGTAPRFTIEGIQIASSNDRLVVTPEETTEENLRLVETVVSAILDNLSHTPVKAFGQNFEFEESDVADTLRSIFEIEDRLAEQLDFQIDGDETQLVSTYRIGECKLNLNRKLIANGNVRLRCNFHYDVTDSASARDLLDGSFVENYERAKQIVAIYSGINAEEQLEQNSA